MSAPTQPPPQPPTPGEDRPSASLEAVYAQVRGQRDALTDQIALLLAERTETRQAVMTAAQQWAAERTALLGFIAESGLTLPEHLGGPAAAPASAEAPVEVEGDVDGATPADEHPADAESPAGPAGLEDALAADPEQAPPRR